MPDKRYRNLPDIVHTLLVYYDAWLGGSGAAWYHQGADPENLPRDYDMIVPVNQWPDTAKRLLDAGANITVNSMGGIKAKFDGGLEIDVWPDTVEEYCKKVKSMGYGKVALISLRPKVELVEPADK